MTNATKGTLTWYCRDEQALVASAHHLWNTPQKRGAQWIRRVLEGWR